ncbi:OsmC family protein [Cellulosimicrobium arenosum]|uniref:OsmC family protein n=1 Tax=Cellulosimicrobium arenosum TaxID=2708133 RepID=A0A927IZS5_9MICO|nr:OsmC family protein [Cellulosimicrobium arenosum]MBD8079029.1 OsmC family protein [Cellulosimicrobium arenosum]
MTTERPADTSTESTDAGTHAGTGTGTEIAPSSPSPSDALWVERTGVRTYTGYSERGAQVQIGPASEGAVFTPGELLKIALAGCAGMSSDRGFARRLGDDYRVVIHVEGAKDMAEDRYPEITERFEIDLSELDDDARERLLTVAERAIEKTCTVGRTIKAGASVQTLFDQPGGSIE